MNPDHLNKPNQPRERSIPITTTQGNLKTTHFPVSSSSHSGTSSGPFSNSPGRGSLFDKLNHFRDQHNDEMFSDRSPFSSFGYPSMSSGSRNVGDFFSHGSREEEEEDCEQESQHQPRVFNIPIQVETPEGVVPLSRSNSHSPSFSQFRNNNNFATPSYGGGPAPERTGDSFQSRQRPGPSPTPPPKPKFTPSYKPESQGFTHQQQYHPHHQPHRVHKIPVQVEKSFKPSESVSNQNVLDSRLSAESSMDRDSPRPESQQSGNSGGPHVINIPVNNGSKQSSENKIHQQQPSQPAPNQSKTTGETPKGSNDPIDIIEDIKTEVSRLESEVNNFDGESQKQYRYLDEMLTRCMLKLDNIESNGRDEVRSARKSTLAYVDRILALLDSKRSRPENEGQMEATEISDVQQQSTEQTPDSMEDESVEVDSNQKQESTIDENIAESSESENPEIPANQMEIESESLESKKTIDDEQPDDQQLEEDEDEEEDGEALEAEDEEDPTGGVDGSSKDFYNSSNNQLSNENICRTIEAVIIEEMDKEEPPKEPPIQVDRSSPDQDEEKVNILELNSSERQQQPQQLYGDGNGSVFISCEPKIELAPDDWDSNNNNHQHDDLMGSVESLDTLKPINNNKVSIVMESDGSNASDDNLDSQPFVEMPDESSISSKDSDENRESISNNNHNMQSSSSPKKSVHA